MGLILTTPPAAEPLTLAEAKDHLRIGSSDTSDDMIVSALIAAARRWAEEELGASIITQTWQLTLSGFPCDSEPIRVPRGPVQSVTSVSYLDSDSQTQTFASTDYLLEQRLLADEIWLKYLKTWPITVEQRNAVTVVFVAGYGDASTDVPEDLRRAMLLRLGDLYRNREGQIVAVTTADNRAMYDLLNAYRRRFSIA